MAGDTDNGGGHACVGVGNIPIWEISELSPFNLAVNLKRLLKIVFKEKES